MPVSSERGGWPGNVRLDRRSVLRALALGAIGGSGVVGAARCALPSGSESGSRRFPDRFGWGVATSAYQIEGAVTADGRGESIWDRFSHTPGKTRGAATGDVAADHYHRYLQDITLMAELGIKSYRFSISWPRVQPTGTGKPNAKGLDFYRRLVEALRERGITPMATLFHWDLPQALQSGSTGGDGQAGWESRDTAYRFADYAGIVYDALGDIVPTFLTINEPKTIVYVGYIYGQHAPGIRSEARAWVAAHHLMLGHGLAVQALRASGKPAKIGPALGLGPTYPAVDDERARAAARAIDGEEIRFWLESVMRGAYPSDMIAYIDQRSPMTTKIHDGDMKIISTPIDVLGVQYYSPRYVDDKGATVVLHPTSEAGWQQIYPDGLYDVLTRVRRDYGDIPIVVTENGIPTPDVLRPGVAGGPDVVDDPQRITFLRDHLAAAQRAIREGVPLIGYHVWSLLDNFEWAEGYSQRWGLTYVDYPTQRRVPKASARWYAGVISANAV